MFQKKTIEIDEHSACIITFALARRLSEDYAVLRVLRIAIERDLTYAEKCGLPSHMRDLSRDMLAEQVDPWISLIMDTEHWIKEFTFDKPDSAN